jgi:hypothetical protein
MSKQAANIVEMRVNSLQRHELKVLECETTQIRIVTMTTLLFIFLGKISTTAKKSSIFFICAWSMAKRL